MKKRSEQIDEKNLRLAVRIAKKQPRLAFYSPLASAVLNYRKSLIPRYSISDELSKIVEAELKRRYPKLTEKVRRLLSSANKRSV